MQKNNGIKSLFDKRCLKDLTSICEKTKKNLTKN